MMIIPGYQILAQIYESTNSLIYRGIREKDHQSVILKVLKEDYPTPNELTRYKQEYEITRNLNLDGVIAAFALETYQRTLVIILEDFGASSLKQIINRQPLNLEEFLKIAIQAAETLGRIHAANVIHKDINPSNIVFNPESGIIKIIDFGISTRLTRENPTLKNPHVLEGTLAYISPEQTGRMNRSLDYRTDFYSLGVTCYELLTGKLPFDTTDVLELVHCHIAKQPVPPHKISPEIPQTISDIVIKLMAKTAEERYQSAWGIKADLGECLKQFQTTGKIEHFPLGSQDISDKFQIPQKLYGREREIEALLTTFERVAGSSEVSALSSQLEDTTQEPKQTTSSWGANDNNPQNFHREMMLVAGYSGIGKSSLVAEIYKPITAKRGYFISGKFDQFQRNIPYSAVVNAFTELVQLLLTERPENLTLWQQKILAALSPNGQVIIDVIPEVELIISKQPAVPELGPAESQNRFNLVFQNFIRAFCTQDHPLVIFLDDLQWADSATLKLIELMMTDTETEYLFLIGAYRDNEVNPTHPLIITLEGLRRQGATINQITLTPLDSAHISQLIADTLYLGTAAPKSSLRSQNIAQIKPLAELIVRKTGGNPFFINQFLKTLHAENLITFDLGDHSWQWQIEEIEAMGITDNVVELMIDKLKKLPTLTQQMLRLAACVGSEFNLKTISIISEKSPKEVFQYLTVAIQLGLILTKSELDNQLLIQNYKFLHDRVQQAAYSLINEAQKKAVHLKIGRLLWQNTTAEELSEAIFEIIDHLNLGIVLVTEQPERKEIARLNLMAGKKAKTAAAYGAAVQYFNAGRELLRADSWQTSYHLSLALYEEAVEAEYLNGDFEQMEKWATVVLQQAKNILEKVKVYEVKIQTCMAQAKQIEAVKLGLQVLDLLGVSLPESPTPLDIQQGLAETTAALAGRKIEELIDLPPMTEADKLAAMRILSSMISPTYQAAPSLLPLIACRQVNLSINYGNSPYSPFAYANYGLILNGVVQDIETAYQFGKLALNTLERLNAKSIKCKTYEIVTAHVMHGKDHIRDTIPILQEGYQSGLETGDLEFCGYCGMFKCQHSYFVGLELTTLEREMAAYSHALTQIKQKNALSWTQIFWQAVLNLLGQAENHCGLLGEAYNEEKSLRIHQQSNDRLGLHYLYLYKLILCYLFKDFPEALRNSVQAEVYLDGATANISVPVFYFYDSLCRLTMYCSAQPDQQKQLMIKVESNQNKMQNYAGYAPINYQHKFDLVEAEKARVLGHVWAAIQLYERAISGARVHKYIQEEALAYELAAEFYLDCGLDKFGQTYLKEAHYGYRHWGATAKVKALEIKYPQLVTKSSTATRMTTHTTTTTTSTESRLGDSLDLATVIKASQAISGEIVLDKLLSSLMKILIENAGAEVGYLILESHGQFVIEASGKVDCDQVTVLQSIPIDNYLPNSIINYVINTQETVVKNDAAHLGRFTNDHYIKKHQTKSILCVPLINQGRIISIVYLENNLTTGAFTPDRLEVLKILSSQAAISIKNARLYADLAEYNCTLEAKVEERTQELSKTLDHLKATQEELIQSEKMAALGQLVAGIAHEVNTPLGAIRSSVGNISKFLSQVLEKLPGIFQSLSPEQTDNFLALIQRSLQEEANFSAKEQRQLKRALISQLTASEIPNADIVADTLVDMGIYQEFDSFLPLLKRPDSSRILEIAYKLSGLQRGTQTIETATERASKVVFALKTYARYDQSVEMTMTNLADGIETVLTLYQNQLKQGVEVIRNYQVLPPVRCYPDELNQVWTNLLHNACQAMENRGILTIEVTTQDQQAKISITDSGSGIPGEILPKIFEPFFTTKPAGEGSGLGLDIVRKIIEKHSGRITVESQPGRTTFNVFIPI